MAVNSAAELHELVSTLGQQFSGIHQPATNQLWNQANQHIETVLSEGGQWITAEIQNLHSEWQAHLQQLQQLEQWFEHHAPNIAKIAEEAARLATDFFA